MAVQVDENGVPRSISLYNPSCMNQLDDIARTVARTMRFEPIAGRINVAMYFDRDTAYSRVTGDTIAHAPPKRGGVFSAFSKGQAPELRNRDYVGRRLLALYPAHLRSSGVSGEVLLWVLVNEKGAAEKTRVKESSGRCELDLAALRVASSMMFSPARKDDVPTKVWIQIPIVFRSML
jgi:TonB family protein